MKLWIGAETQADATDALRPVRSEVERAINSLIEQNAYHIGVESWDCIVILRDDQEFREVVKLSKAKRDMDFRLRLDYHRFMGADELGRRKLLLELLLRSLDLLKVKGGDDLEVDKLSAEVRNVGIKKGWI